MLIYLVFFVCLYVLLCMCLLVLICVGLRLRYGLSVFSCRLRLLVLLIVCVRR